MSINQESKLREAVLEHYREAAKKRETGGSSCCGSSGCCQPTASQISTAIGYTKEQLESLPKGANLGLGCGNPHLAARLKTGETVLDLGSGGGIDCFIAARQVGPHGQVIGIDMTPEMVALARKQAEEAGVDNVSFRLGEIEHLPVADSSVDVIMSNCVVNLSPDKRAVYREAFRVLKPGGRLAISDVVAYGPLPEELHANLQAWSMCAAGALPIDDLTATLKEVGFEQVKVDVNRASRDLIVQWLPDSGIEDLLAAAVVEAVKPA